MNIGVVGSKGYVGSVLVQRGITPIECDVTELSSVNGAVIWELLDVVIYAAGITDVGYCEEHEMEALKVNALGVSNVLRYFTKGHFIYLSTDHVFPDGKSKTWLWNEKSERKPVNKYGMTKMIGEQVSNMGTPTAHIIRTSKLFSMGTIKDDLEKLQNGEELEFTNLIHRSFMHVEHFVDNLIYFIENIEDMPEVLHIAGRQCITYYWLWNRIAFHFGIDEKLVKPRNHKIKDYPRPFKGGLDTTKAEKLGIPNYSFANGILLMKEEGI